MSTAAPLVDLDPPREQGFEVRHATARDQEALLALLERYVSGAGAVARYQWLYRQIPQGWAHSWLAFDRATGAILGFTSIFARELSIEGQLVKAGVGVDAFVRPERRRRGIGLALHRASRDAMRRRQV